MRAFFPEKLSVWPFSPGIADGFGLGIGENDSGRRFRPVGDNKQDGGAFIDKNGNRRLLFWRVKSVTSSVSMYMIPANRSVAEALRSVREDPFADIEGWLVDITLPQEQDGMRTSLTGNDSGSGSCEIVLVGAITMER